VKVGCGHHWAGEGRGLSVELDKARLEREAVAV